MPTPPRWLLKQIPLCFRCERQPSLTRPVCGSHLLGCWFSKCLFLDDSTEKIMVSAIVDPETTVRMDLLCLCCPILGYARNGAAPYCSHARITSNRARQQTWVRISFLLWLFHHAASMEVGGCELHFVFFGGRKNWKQMSTLQHQHTRTAIRGPLSHEDARLRPISIGRIRNWPKSKLAEVEINWPKSNRWCLLCFFFLSFFLFLFHFSSLFSCSYSSLSSQPELNPKPRTLHPISLDNPPPDRPKFRSFFSLLPPQFSFFFPSLGVLSLNYVLVFEGRAGATRELQTCTFWEPSASNTTKIHERTPRERKKKENCGGRREKKSAKFWPPTLRGPPFQAPLFLGLHPSGPHPSGLHPSLPHFVFAPPCEAPPFEGPTPCRPKIQHPKIGRNRIGRSRNWPKSKLAEVEIGRSRNWPKSKLAEVELAELEKKKLAEVEIGRSRSRSLTHT